MEPSDHFSSHQQSHSRAHLDDSMASGRKRVGFTQDTPPDYPVLPSPLTPEEAHAVWSGSGNQNTTGQNTTGQNTPVPHQLVRNDVSHVELSEAIHKAFGHPIPKPRPAIRKTDRTPPPFSLDVEPDEDEGKRRSGLAAQQRATRLARTVGTYPASAPTSRRNSNDRLMARPVQNVPLQDLRHDPYSETTDDDNDTDATTARQEFMKQADQILRQHSTRGAPSIRPEDLYHSEPTPLHSGQVTPTNAVEIGDEHVPRPSKFRTGVLGTLLRASTVAQAQSTPSRSPKTPNNGKNPGTSTPNFSTTSTAAGTPVHSPTSSGVSTPNPQGKPWYLKNSNASTVSISKLIDSSSMLATPGQNQFGQEMGEKSKKAARPGMGKRSTSKESIISTFGKMNKARDEQIKIKIHLAGTLARQNYLRKLCKALMMYGAPTHRLEEYMNMSARVLEIEAQFLYMPGCMIIAFDDSSVHTTEVKLVRTNQGVDLGKLRDVHEIYKDVVHDRIGVDEATPRMESIIARDPKFGAWYRVPVYGLASALVGPFAFEARPIDLPFCFLLGCFLGWLQLIVAPGNELISNVFEISAAVVTSFVARGVGSIRHNGTELFCFSAIAQSSIALILPGFTVLSASLELQSRHIVAGSVRMVYAIIYSLFLGFGITIGTVLFGLMYSDATSATTCKNPMSSHWYYFFVLGFALCLMVINQAKLKQMPSMAVIALIGYVVSYHSSHYFQGNAQINNTLGAFAIGVSANVHARFGRHVENWGYDFWENTLRPRYVRIRKRWLRRNHGRQHATLVSAKEHSLSRSSSMTSRPDSLASEPYIPYQRKIGYGLAAAAMLPAIFVQVPSGLSVSGSLVSGITSADQITRNTTGTTTVSGTSTSSINTVALNVGYSVIQVAIGITVGLFLAALLVYPFGKRRSGLFSF